MTTIVHSKARKRRIVKRTIPRIAEERGTTAKALLNELFEKYGNQDGIAKDLGVSQGTVSLEMLRQGLDK